MQTRRDFCKNILAAGVASASLQSFAKSYCGVDFGNGAPESVWIRGGHYSPLPGVKCQGAWFHEFVAIPYREVFHELLGYCDHAKVDFEGGLCSTKTLYLRPLKEESTKDKREQAKRKRMREYEVIKGERENPIL